MIRKIDFQNKAGLWVRSIIVTLLATCFTLINPQAYAQSPAKEETIKIINEALEPGSSLSWISGELQLIQYNELGRTMRQDRVSPDALDLTIFHDEDNDMLCIPCMNGRTQCVTRTLSSTQRKRTMNSLHVPVKDAREFYLLMRAFEHLIRLTSENDYKAVVDFE